MSVRPRGRPRIEQPRRVVLSVAVSDRECGEILSRANGRSVSELLRNLLLDRAGAVEKKTGLIDLLPPEDRKELVRISGRRNVEDVLKEAIQLGMGMIARTDRSLQQAD